MSPQRGFAPRRYTVPVEAASSGADRLDGNETNNVVSWLFATEDWVDENVPDVLISLMENTVLYDHLAWVVFPPYGYRV